MFFEHFGHVCHMGSRSWFKHLGKPKQTANQTDQSDTCRKPWENPKNQTIQTYAPVRCKKPSGKPKKPKKPKNPDPCPRCRDMGLDFLFFLFFFSRGFFAPHGGVGRDCLVFVVFPGFSARIALICLVCCLFWFP